MSRYEGLRELTEDDREDYRLQECEARDVTHEHDTDDTHDDDTHEADHEED